MVANLHMFSIVAEVFGNIKNCFFFHIIESLWLAALCVAWLVCGWFVDALGGLWVIWVICRWFGWLVASLTGLRMVCGQFGWFVGGFADLWVVLLICGWFRVLQLTLFFNFL